MPRTTEAGLIAFVMAVLAFAPAALAEEAKSKDAAGANARTAITKAIRPASVVRGMRHVSA